MGDSQNPTQDFLSQLLNGIKGGVNRVAAAGQPAGQKPFTQQLSDFFTNPATSTPSQPIKDIAQGPTGGFVQGISDFFTKPNVQPAEAIPQSTPQATPTPEYELSQLIGKQSLQHNFPGGSTNSVIEGHPDATKTAIDQGLITPTPTRVPTPTPVPQTGDTLGSTTTSVGRTPKFELAKKNNEEGYQTLATTLDSLQATPIEKQLVMDVAAQESMLDAGRKASDHGYDGVTINKETGKPYPYSSSAGLFMFNDATWKDYLKANPEAAARGADRLNPTDATEAFLYAIRNGITGQGLSRWNASKDVWGQGYTPEELATFKQ